jgi:cytochrome c biogenesis protein CcmG/thiol:disulfide interchange protein DsbE
MKSSRWFAVVCLSALLAGSLLRAAEQRSVRSPLRPPGEREPAPSFQLHDASGKTVALADFEGKPVVLNLWATECGGCKEELPSFVALHRAYNARGVRVIGVSMDVMYEGLKSPAEGWARVTPFARAHGLSYTILLDDGSVEEGYRLTAMPATYLIDKHGRIAATYVGIVDEGDVKANIEKLLAEAR